MFNYLQGGPVTQRPPLPYEYYRSNPTSPTQQSYNTSNSGPRAAYHPSVRGGVPVFPPGAVAAAAAMAAHQSSPQVKRKPSLVTAPTTPTGNASTTPSENRRRPMSFVRALEMSDSLEMMPNPPNKTGPNNSTVVPANSNDTRQQDDTNPNDRASVYDMNYEISV